jgi:hypothetical protein
VSHRRWAIVSSALGLATLAVYLTTISIQGDDSVWDVFPWAALMIIPAILTTYAAIFPEGRVARHLLYGSAALYGLIGVIGIWSVGFGFLVAGVLAAVAAGRIPRI